MAIDLKYGKVTAEKGDRVHGEAGVPLNNSNEPVFILRAQDITSLQVLTDYRHRSRVAGASKAHVDSINKVIDAFTKWQKKNSDKVKIPD